MNADARGRVAYSILLPAETQARAAAYLDELRRGTARPGARLAAQLAGVELGGLELLDCVGSLIDTKPPQIFAESAVFGDGTDWNPTELGLLGDISIAVPVAIYDNGAHRHPLVHPEPFDGTLVFTPGALLRNDRGVTPVDLPEVTGPDGRLDPEGYYQLYRRRLLPVLRFIDERAGCARSAFVTVPGLGCGQFAGPFQGRLGEQLRLVLRRLLVEHGDQLVNLAAVYYDPFDECHNIREEIHGISLSVRPLQRDNHGKSQLCPPATYAEPGDDFSRCRLFSLVAWDHVSWPGNDFFGGSRTTDDGVKAAATSSMAVITGVEGHYDPSVNKYQPPHDYVSWGEVVSRRHLRLWDPQALW